MPANISLPLTVSWAPMHVYVTLAIYGVAIAGLLLYIHRKFSKAQLLLAGLSQDWQSAESQHKLLLTQAKERVSKLEPAPAGASATPAARRTITTDARNQIAKAGRKGLSTPEIARSCGIPEADVEVLLGIEALQR